MQKHFYLIILGLFSLKQIEACEAVLELALPEQAAVQQLEFECEIIDNVVSKIQIKGGVAPYKVSCGRIAVIDSTTFHLYLDANQAEKARAQSYHVRVEDAKGKVAERIVTSTLRPPTHWDNSRYGMGGWGPQ